MIARAGDVRQAKLTTVSTESLVPARPVLDSIVFQVIYGGGYTYLDRCGQSLVDIERARPDWVPGEVNVFAGSINNEKLGMSVTFTVDRFNFSASKQPGVGDAAEEAQSLWEIVRENLNLSEYVRVGCRFQWILAKKSTEAAEHALAKGEFNVQTPPSWLKSGFEQVSRSVVAGFKRGSVEYRVALQAGTRTEGVSPTLALTAIEPRMLPKGRREAQLAAIKNRQTYNRDPMYVVNLDVDCATYGPSLVKPSLYMVEQSRVVQETFVPVLEKL